MESPQPQPLKSAPGPHISKILIPLVVLVAVIVGYGVLAKNNGWWSQEIATTSPSPTPLIIDTSSWQTYRNEKSGFEIKYPADLRMELTKDAMPIGIFAGQIMKGSDPNFEFYVNVSAEPVNRIPSYKNLETYVNSIKARNEEESLHSATGVRFELGKSVVANEPAITLESIDTSAVGNSEATIFVQHGSFLYTLFFSYPHVYINNHVDAQEYEKLEVINKIIDSFKFTN